MLCKSCTRCVYLCEQTDNPILEEVEGFELTKEILEEFENGKGED